MVTIFWFGHSDWNNPLIMKHLWSNEWVFIIESINLGNAHDLEHYSAREILLSILKYVFFRVEVFSDIFYELFSCVEISVNQIPTKYVQLMQW